MRVFVHIDGILKLPERRGNCSVVALQHTATHCNTLQRTTRHCNARQHTATTLQPHCNTTEGKQITPTYKSVIYQLQHTATNCNTLQHTATHCNRAATHYNTRDGGEAAHTEVLDSYVSEW